MLGPSDPPTPCEVLLATIRACTVRAICSALKRAEPDSREGRGEQRRGEGERREEEEGGEDGEKEEEIRKEEERKKAGGEGYNKQTHEFVQVISWRNFGTIRSEVTTCVHVDTKCSLQNGTNFSFKYMHIHCTITLITE